MNILVTYREADAATYRMLGDLSKDTSFKIYVYVPFDAGNDGIQGHCIPLKGPKITSKFSWKVIQTLRKYIKEYQIDVVFSPSTSGLSNALFATLGTSVKNVGYRGTQAKVKKFDPTYYMALLNPRVDHIVCETQDIQEYLTQYIHPSKLSVSVKPYDVAWVADACAHPQLAEGVPEDAFKCIYIGNTKGRPFKGLTFLIKALHLLNDSQIHLTMIGDYDQQDYDLVQNGPCSKQIHFLGIRPALPYIPKQNLFILPALRDASPRVVREAMACSVPCIVSDIPGARDLIVDKKTGLLVPSGSPEKIAEAIRQLKEDHIKLEAFAKASRERIINDFSVEDYVSYFSKLFTSLSER